MEEKSTEKTVKALMKKTAFKPEAFKSLEAYSQEFASGKLYIFSSARRGIEHCQKQPLWVLVFGVHMRKKLARAAKATPHSS